MNVAYYITNTLDRDLYYHLFCKFAPKVWNGLHEMFETDTTISDKEPE